MVNPSIYKDIVLFAEISDEETLGSICDRFFATGADALILGQYPYLDLGYVDPITGICEVPNAEAFAVKRSCYEEIGAVDLKLRSARAADYALRMRCAGKKIKMATDILVQVSAPCSVTESWIDGKLFSYKYADGEERRNIRREILSAIRSYDRTIGNYSRKELVQSFPHFISGFLSYCGKRIDVYASAPDYFLLSNIRGQYGAGEKRLSGDHLVSLILRTHERPQVLKKTLENLRSLDYSNFEIVLIEDGRPTAREMVKKEFADLNIRYFSTGENVGRAAAANIGFRMAQGEWLNLIDDDDFFFPEHLRIGLETAEDTGADMVFLQAVALEVDTSFDPYSIQVRKMHHMDFPHIDVFSMVSECKTADNGVLFRRELLKSCGEMREDLKAHEDWSLWLRLMTRAKWVNVPYATCLFVNPASEEDRIRREKGYSAYDGLQFDDPLLVYETSGEDARRYLINTVNDLCALDEEGSLSETLQKVQERYPYEEKVLEEAFESWISAVENKETKSYTAKEFHLWYCGLLYTIYKEETSNRRVVLEGLKQKHRETEV